MTQRFAPGDDLLFQLESGFGLLRVIAVEDHEGKPVWHLMAYEELFPDSESAEQALADPDWFVKVKRGRGVEVRRCTYTNYCEALDQAHRQVTCKLWDRKELDEVGIAMASDGRRRLLPMRWSRGS